MKPLESLKEYIEGFHQIDFKCFERDLNNLYDDFEDLHTKIEFSLLINELQEFNLRFGLFKIYEPNRIISLLEKKGIERKVLENIFSSAKEFVPEFAIGFDLEPKKTRIKLYFLRLPDNQKFNETPQQFIRNLSNLTGANGAEINKKISQGCYLLGIDFQENQPRHLKIYTKRELVEFEKITEKLRIYCASPKHLNLLFQLFSEGEKRDVTFSRRLINNQRFSIFFDSSSDSDREIPNDEIDNLIKLCCPKKYALFKQATMPLENNGRIKYSNIGLTFSDEEPKESICLYFSQKIPRAK